MAGSWSSALIRGTSSGRAEPGRADAARPDPARQELAHNSTARHAPQSLTGRRPVKDYPRRRPGPRPGRNAWAVAGGGAPGHPRQKEKRPPARPARGVPPPHKHGPDRPPPPPRNPPPPTAY